MDHDRLRVDLCYHRRFFDWAAEVGEILDVRRRRGDLDVAGLKTEHGTLWSGCSLCYWYAGDDVFVTARCSLAYVDGDVSRTQPLVLIDLGLPPPPDGYLGSLSCDETVPMTSSGAVIAATLIAGVRMRRRSDGRSRTNHRNCPSPDGWLAD